MTAAGLVSGDKQVQGTEPKGKPSGWALLWEQISAVRVGMGSHLISAGPSATGEGAGTELHQQFALQNSF